MKLELLMPWRHYSKGYILTDVPAGQASLMIHRQIAKEVIDPPKEQPRLVRAKGK